MSIGEGQRLVVHFAAIVEILIPSDCTLVAIELKAERAVHNLIIRDESHLLLNVACTVVIGEMTVGDTGKEETFVLAIA